MSRRLTVALPLAVALLLGCGPPEVRPGDEPVSTLTMDQLAERLRAIHVRATPTLHEIARLGDAAPPPSKACEAGIAELTGLVGAPVLSREPISRDGDFASGQDVYAMLNLLFGEHDDNAAIAGPVRSWGELCERVGRGGEAEAALTAFLSVWRAHNQPTINALCDDLRAINARHETDCGAKAGALRELLARPKSELLYRLPSYEGELGDGGADDPNCSVFLDTGLTHERCRDDVAVRAAWCDGVAQTDTLTDEIAGRCFHAPPAGRLTTQECASLGRRTKRLLEKRLHTHYGGKSKYVTAKIKGKAIALPMWDRKACNRLLGHDDYHCVVEAKDHQALERCRGIFEGQGVRQIALGPLPALEVPKPKPKRTAEERDRDLRESQQAAYEASLEWQQQVAAAKKVFGKRLDCRAVKRIVAAAADDFADIRGALRPAQAPSDPQAAAQATVRDYITKPGALKSADGVVYHATKAPAKGAGKGAVLRSSAVGRWVAVYEEVHVSPDKDRNLAASREITDQLLRCLKGVKQPNAAGGTSDGRWKMGVLYGDDRTVSVVKHAVSDRFMSIEVNVGKQDTAAIPGHEDVYDVDLIFRAPE